MSVLRASGSDLHDLADGCPELVEASNSQPAANAAGGGEPTGVRLTRYLGAGGMSAVFLAEVDGARRSSVLSPSTPKKLAIKFMLPDTERELVRFNMDPMAIFVKEAVALGRVMERKPPTEFVVGFYGSRKSNVSIAGAAPRPLPWLAIELVDGGTAGTSLTDRVRRAHEGVDPIRALRLVRGIVEGVRVLHAEKVVHRDLKPDNVLVAGPLDDETPKLADCGIARIEGMPGVTIAAMTPEYGGPEQAIAIPGQSNPLVGAWTDIHALAAVIWFIIGGEPWCTSNVDRAWHAGERRSLRSASRLHPAYASDGVIAALDAVLTRGAAHRLPDVAWRKDGAERLLSVARARYPSMFAGPERYESVDAFASALVPVLERVAASWTQRAAKENAAATAFRPTQMLRAEEIDAKMRPLARVRVNPAPPIDGTHSTFNEIDRATPGGVVFQPDGKVLARFGERLVYFVAGEPHKVGVPDALRETVRATRWVVRGPGGGFALIGPSHVVLVRGGRMAHMPLPKRDGGGEVGEIQAVIGDGRVFGVVTAETDDSNGGPELWKSVDGAKWSAPIVLPLGGDAHALADGAYGMIVVGSRRGTKARALFLGLDDQTMVYTAGVNDKAPLTVAVGSATRESWAAGDGVVLRLEKGSAVPEKLEAPCGAPVAMALDLVGVPWLVTERAVLRRHVESNEGLWKIYYRRDDASAPLCAIGFTPDGAAVLAATGGTVEIEPHDIASWRARG